MSYGPWITARFDSGDQIFEGDRIRSDGEGGWLCEPCGEEGDDDE